MTIDPKKLEAARMRFGSTDEVLRTCGVPDLEARAARADETQQSLEWAYQREAVWLAERERVYKEIAALKAELARFEWRPSMKPETVKKVAEAIELDLDIQEMLLADPITLRQLKAERIARKAIRAVMESDEVRVMRGALREIAGLELQNYAAGVARKALSQLEASK